METGIAACLREGCPFCHTERTRLLACIALSESSAGPAPSGPTETTETQTPKYLAPSGLYTPADRAAALVLLQAHCPELDGIVFDADSDGLVTALEQDGEGRDPLSTVRSTPPA